MTETLLTSLLTILGSGGAAWLAIRVEIRWIVKTLDRHEHYHETHFKNGGSKNAKIVRTV